VDWVDTNSGLPAPNPKSRAESEPKVVTLALDEAAGISAELARQPDGTISLAIHDPAHSETDDDEVYALRLDPDRARALGSHLVAMARAASLRRAAGQ
jgi:hypothetical protein